MLIESARTIRRMAIVSGRANSPERGPLLGETRGLLTSIYPRLLLKEMGSLYSKVFSIYWGREMVRMLNGKLSTTRKLRIPPRKQELLIWINIYLMLGQGLQKIKEIIEGSLRMFRMAIG